MDLLLHPLVASRACTAGCVDGGDSLRVGCRWLLYIIDDGGRRRSYAEIGRGRKVDGDGQRPRDDIGAVDLVGDCGDGGVAEIMDRG